MSRPTAVRFLRDWVSSPHMPRALVGRLSVGLLFMVSPALLAQSADEPPAGVRELRQFGPQLSMDWVSDRRLQSPDDPMAAAVEMLRLWPEDPLLRRAMLRYAAISVFYRTGLVLYRGRPATLDDIPDLARAFVAGLTDDPEGNAATIGLALRGLVEANAKIRAGSELIAIAAREHAAIWSSLGELVRSGAGPETSSAPLGVAVVVGDGASTGLQFVNESGQTLHDVVLAVDSTLATADQGNVCTHTIFVPTWAPQRAVLLPPRLMLGAARGGGGSVAYSLWADEMHCLAQSVSLAAGRAKGQAPGGAPVVLRLGGERRPASPDAPRAPAAAADAADDCGLAEATEQLDRSQLKEAQAALAEVESKLAKGAASDEARQAVLAVARYRAAEAMRLAAFAEARASANDENAKKTLLRAKRKYGEVLDLPDTATAREGTSLHAATLRHVVHIDAILCQAYRWQAKQRPKEKNLGRSAEAHEASAKRGLKALEERFAEARDVDGRTYLDAAKAAVRDVMQAR